MCAYHHFVCCAFVCCLTFNAPPLVSQSRFASSFLLQEHPGGRRGPLPHTPSHTRTQPHTHTLLLARTDVPRDKRKRDGESVCSETHSVASTTGSASSISGVTISGRSNIRLLKEGDVYICPTCRSYESRQRFMSSCRKEYLARRSTADSDQPLLLTQDSLRSVTNNPTMSTPELLLNLGHTDTDDQALTRCQKSLSTDHSPMPKAGSYRDVKWPFHPP